MKKIIKITLVFILALLIVSYSEVFASDYTDSDEKLAYNIEIAAPESGIYGEGQEVTISLTFNKGIKGAMPNYKIYFGKSSASENIIEVETEEITEFTNVVEYKYTIKSGDNGELMSAGFSNPSNYKIECEDGSSVYLSSPFGWKFATTILADTTIQWSDFSKATLELVSDSNSYSDFDIQIKNNTLEEKKTRYMHFSHDANEDITLLNSEDVTSNNEFWTMASITSANKIILNSTTRDIFAEVGDVYITICEIDSVTSVPKIVLKSEKIEKLSAHELTQRISGYFFNEYTSIICWDLHSENQNNVNYKIGKVTDLDLLKKLKNGDASALSDLMEYAKEAEKIDAGTLEVKNLRAESIMEKLNISNNEYYYIYLQLDSVDGKYVAVEDIALYQGLITSEGEKYLIRMDDSEFSWNIEENKQEEPKEEKKEETKEEQKEQIDTTVTTEEKLPYAGNNIIIYAILAVLLIVTIVGGIKYQKYNFKI